MELNDTAEAGQEHDTAEDKPALQQDVKRDLGPPNQRHVSLKKFQKTSPVMKSLKIPSSSTQTTAGKKKQNLPKLKNRKQRFGNEKKSLNETAEDKPALQEDEKRNLKPPNQRPFSLKKLQKTSPVKKSLKMPSSSSKTISGKKKQNLPKFKTIQNRVKRKKTSTTELGNIDEGKYHSIIKMFNRQKNQRSSSNPA